MRTLLVKALMVGLLVSLGQPLALAKKKKDTSARLRSLETIYVQGFGQAAEYIRRNLVRETCLKHTMDEDTADAILDVWEGVKPCRQALSGYCQAISAKLIDRPSKDVLWYRSDEEMGAISALGVRDKPGQWILWHLSNACCKGRPSPPPRLP